MGTVPQNYGANLTMIAALSLHGVDATKTVEGETDAKVFQAYVEQVLGPTLLPGDIVILDNLGAHKTARIHEVIEGRGARVIHFPPYSPDLAAIEQCWSKFKTCLRTARARTREVPEAAIEQALTSITAADARSWFAYCCYTVS